MEKARNYLTTESMSKKQKKVCKTLNYIDNLLILPFAVTGCLWISDFALLIGIPIGITSSAIVLKSCAIITGTKTLSQ